MILQQNFQNISEISEQLFCIISLHIFPVIVEVNTPFNVQGTAERKGRCEQKKKKIKGTMFSNINNGEIAAVAEQRTSDFT